MVESLMLKKNAQDVSGLNHRESIIDTDQMDKRG